MDASSSRRGEAGRQQDKTRRCWSDREERVLIDSLKELVTLGWKSDNGFRAGYLNKLDEAMRRVFPGTDIRAQPHINSKLTSWKKNYSSLVSMLLRSGVGFNNSTKLIECEDDLWETVVQLGKLLGSYEMAAVHSNARTMRYKRWQLFDDWKDVFGKDRATGETAEDVMDAVNELMQDDAREVPARASARTKQVDVDDNFEFEEEGNSCSQSGKTPIGSESRGKKRKSSGHRTDEIYEMLSKMCKNADDRLEKLAQRIGYDFELGAAKKKVFEELSNLPGLDINQKFDVCEILAEKTERLEIFMGLPLEARAQYVARLLGGPRN